MADISQIILPNGNNYNLKDAEARNKEIAKSYTATIEANNWSNNSNTITISTLKCGKLGDISPIIFPINNVQEYSLITSAIATPGTGITFTALKTINNDISINIIDFN